MAKIPLILTLFSFSRLDLILFNFLSSFLFLLLSSLIIIAFLIDRIFPKLLTDLSCTMPHQRAANYSRVSIS